VRWGGDPTTPKLVEDRFGPRLSPRTSFAAWTQQVRATSAPWRPHEVAAAEQLARHVGDVASRRAEEETQVAAALQRTLLLEQLPHVPGVALAARYLPSAADVVGGDWYDLVLLPTGRVASCSATWPGTDWALRPSPPSCGTPCGRSCCRPPARPRPSAGSTTSPPTCCPTSSPPPSSPSSTRHRAAHRRERRPPARAAARRRRPSSSTRAAGRRSGMLPGRGVRRRRAAAARRRPAGAVQRRARRAARAPTSASASRSCVDVAATAPRDADALLDVLLERLAPPDADDVTVVALGRRAQRPCPSPRGVRPGGG
jgi:hypothetical protein